MKNINEKEVAPSTTEQNLEQSLEQSTNGGSNKKNTDTIESQYAEQHISTKPKKDFFLTVDELNHFCVLGYN